jgi:hypothetical protein
LNRIGVLPVMLNPPAPPSSNAIGPIITEASLMSKPFSDSLSMTSAASTSPVFWMMMTWLKVSPGSATPSPSVSLGVRWRVTPMTTGILLPPGACELNETTRRYLE